MSMNSGKNISVEGFVALADKKLRHKQMASARVQFGVEARDFVARYSGGGRIMTFEEWNEVFEESSAD